MRDRIRLVHWNPVEAERRALSLQRMGFEVTAEPLTPAGLRDLRARPPSAVVIDLERLPARGRDVGVALRTYAATRRVPLVFVGGSEEKVAHVQELLPDAVYAEWTGIRASLKAAIARPPTEPVVPRSLLAGYSGTPLPQKLGIKAGSTVSLVGAPEGFEEHLPDLPAGATLRRGLRGRPDLIIVFVASERDLERKLSRAVDKLGRDGLWLAWPKRSSGVGSDLTQARVRQIGLAAGLVDYKVCAIDSTWSGLRFTKRRIGQ